MTKDNLTFKNKALDYFRAKRAKEYCEILLLPWANICWKFGNAYEMDQRRASLHESIEKLWDIDRNFVKTAADNAFDEYHESGDFSNAYDAFVKSLNETAMLPVYERHPDLKFLKDLEEGKMDDQLKDLQFPSLGGTEK